MSIEPELPTGAVTLVAELTPSLAGAAQFRMEQFLLGERDGASPVDVARMDPEKDIGVAFAQTLRGELEKQEAHHWWSANWLHLIYTLLGVALAELYHFLYPRVRRWLAAKNASGEGVA